MSVSSSESCIFTVKPSSATKTPTETFSHKSDNDVWIDEQINEIIKSGSSRIYNSNSAKKIVYKVYTRRWFILILFGLYSGSSSSHWLHYSIIGNVVRRLVYLPNRKIENFFFWTNN